MYSCMYNNITTLLIDHFKFYMCINQNYYTCIIIFIVYYRALVHLRQYDSEYLLDQLSLDLLKGIMTKEFWKKFSSVCV